MYQALYRKYRPATFEDVCGQEHITKTLKNEIIGNKYNSVEEAKTTWNYKAVETIEEALTGADFVIISIQPGTFDEMESDVHAPEKYMKPFPRKKELYFRFAVL
mgnify:CR=1 FL=1